MTEGSTSGVERVGAILAQHGRGLCFQPDRCQPASTVSSSAVDTLVQAPLEKTLIVV